MWWRTPVEAVESVPAGVEESVPVKVDEESVPVEVVEEVPADGEQEAAAVEEEKKELSRYSRGVGSGEVGRTKGMNFGKLFKLVLSLAPGMHQSVTMFIGVSTGSRLDSGKFEYFFKGLSDYYVCVHIL